MYIINLIKNVMCHIHIYAYLTRKMKSLKDLRFNTSEKAGKSMNQHDF